MSVSQPVFRDTLGRFASGVVVVTGIDAAGPAGLTCQSFCSVSLDPPLIAVSPSLRSASWRRIEATGTFAVSVLASHQRELCLTFGQGGREDKFASAGWEPAPSGSPWIGGAVAWLDCAIVAAHPAGDHLMVLGEVEHLANGDGDPLLFHRGGFGTFSLFPRVLAGGPASDEVWGPGPWQEGVDW
jgi:3-hydroxy-9,10-secoandrosta-1,3,5(10)-triene-9,17-dione monooxygenase reductase component